MPVSTEFEFRMPVARPPSSSVMFDHLMVACARGMVKAQQALDDKAKDSIERWEEDGIPPSAVALRQCRVRFPITLTVVPRRSDVVRARLKLRPRFEGQAFVTVSYRYLSGSQSE